MKWVYREWLQLKGSYPNSRFKYMNATWPSFCFGIAWQSFIISWIACFYCSCTSPSLIIDRDVCIWTERHSRSRTSHSQFYHCQLKQTIQAAIQRWSQKKCFKTQPTYFNHTLWIVNVWPCFYSMCSWMQGEWYVWRTGASFAGSSNFNKNSTWSAIE